MIFKYLQVVLQVIASDVDFKHIHELNVSHLLYRNNASYIIKFIYY